MIRIRLLTGPYVGTVRDMPQDTEPVVLLSEFMRRNWSWEVDYSQASGVEIVRWGRVDLTLRAFRAMRKGLPVRFLGQVYTDPQELEDAIVLHGAGGVSITRDDEIGVEIMAHQQPLVEPWATHTRAQMLILERMPQVSEYKKDAFVRAVAALVVGLPLGTTGGPSVREHAAMRLYGQQRHTFDTAVDLLIAEDGVIFGPITDLHRQVWVEEFCFGDDPEDVAELTRST